MSFWRRPFKSQGDDGSAPTSQDGNLTDDSGSLQYVGELGGNDAPPTYQEAGGAPIEASSPLGYSVGPVTILFLNISMMVGTGIYSTPSAILRGTGSVGLSIIFWVLGGFISIAGAAVYLEFASYFPSRSGAEVVYLEQAYPRPRFFFPTTFAVMNVVLSFKSSNAIVLADYLFATGGTVGTNWQVKGVAAAGYTVAFLAVAFHTKYSYYLSNAIGAVKLVTLIFIAITGLVVLGGHSKVEDPTANFKNAFEGAPTAYGLTNALYRIIFSYAGYYNSFNVVNEIKNPIKQIKRNTTISILLITVLYVLAHIAYLAAVPKDTLENSGTIAASLFFSAVFGSSNASRGLNFLIALSSFGNLIAVLLGSGRILRECGRQGVLPFPRFWASTWPFGTPLGPYFLDWATTIVIIIAIPTGDAFNFVSDLTVLPTSVFTLMMGIGLYLVRWRRAKANLPAPEFRAWHPVVIFNILVMLYLVVMPWYPPPGGKGDVSFWYGTYVVTGIALLLICAVYYFIWVKVLPRVGGYRLRSELVKLGNGAQTHNLVKVPVAELKQWDEAHDAAGRPVALQNSSDQAGFDKDVGVISVGEKPQGQV
ncbi:amino acid permease-domain-containing protein [Xylariales sp. PMI_506]|nr:amino acid permease-domain-containing protein [Xylariales sp. PMI_506]